MKTRSYIHFISLTVSIHEYRTTVTTQFLRNQKMETTKEFIQSLPAKTRCAICRPNFDIHLSRGEIDTNWMDDQVMVSRNAASPITSGLSLGTLINFSSFLDLWLSSSPTSTIFPGGNISIWLSSNTLASHKH